MEDNQPIANQPITAPQSQPVPPPPEPPFQPSSTQPSPARHMHPHMMVMVIAVIVIIAIAVIAASFLLSSKNTTSPAQTTVSGINASNATTTVAMSHTKTMLLNDLALANSSQNVEISYVSNSTGILGSYNLSKYILGKESKTVSTINVLGSLSTISLYETHGITVACIKSATANNTCSLVNTTQGSASLTNTQIISLPGVTVNYLGTSTVLNRSCDSFTATGDVSSLNAVQSSTPSNSTASNSNTTFDMHLCVDKQTGIVLNTNITVTTHSQSGNQTAPLTSLKATSFSTGTVTSADLTPPVNVIVTGTHNATSLLTYIDCNSTALSFQVMPTVTLSKLNMTGAESGYNSTTNTYVNKTLFNTTRTGNYNAFSLYKITVPESIVPQQPVTICVNSACSQGISCYS